MNINFELYKIFYEVANLQSISKAALKLMISQPAVTQSIKTLENGLGGKLFIRTPKGVVLTNEGEELFSYIKEGMNYFINGTNKFNSLKNLEEGVLNIGSTTTISEHYLISYLKQFHSKYPNIDINITNDLTDNLIKDLRNGTLDIIITAIPSNKIKDIEYRQITDLNDVFVGGSLYKDKVYSDINDLLKEDVLLQKTPSVTRNNFNDFLKENKLECNPKMEVVSHGLLTSLAENNFGIALLTKEFIKDKLDKTLFEVKTSIKIPKRKLGYAIKSNNIPSFTALKFIEILTEKI
ncbi:MAG: LysR family transcriptional regulator [Bacilli bacterium]|nr:LysR family transcriptional regulator [Bacilli bacterium]